MSAQKRPRRFSIHVVNYVKLRAMEGWGAKQIFDELIKRVEEETIVDYEGIERSNPLYQQAVPPDKTIQRWHREFRSEAGRSEDDQAAAQDKWHSTIEPDPDDASVILAALSEVAIHSQGHTNSFTKDVAAQVLRVTRLAPGIPPYIAWLSAKHYLEAERSGNASVIEALDLLLGMLDWEKWGKGMYDYKRLIELGKITAAPSELLEEIEQMIDLQIKRRFVIS